MTMFEVKMKLPSIEKDFNAKYTHVEKPTGIEYALLTIIGTPQFERMDWEDVMEMIGVDDVLFRNIFKPALWGMSSRGMIEYADHRGTVNDAKFTNMGREAFDKRVIATNPQPLSGRISFCPGKLTKYQKDSDVRTCSMDDFDASRFSEFNPDDQSIENTIIRNKSRFGVDKDSEIFDLDIGSEASTRCYECGINLAVNEVTGDFRFSANDLDENFLKATMVAKDLLGKLSPNVFQSPINDVEFEKWGKCPDWESFRYIAPRDVKFNGHKLVAVNMSSCSKNSDNIFQVDDSMGCDLLFIDTSETGHEYCLVRHDAGVEGLEGTVPCNLVVGRQIGKEHIDEFITKTVESIGVDTLDNFKRALGVAKLSSDSNIALGVVKRRLAMSKDIDSDIQILESFRSEGWYKEFEEKLLEQTIIDKGMSPEQASKLLTEHGLKVDGYELAKHYSSQGTDPLETIDVLYGAVSNRLLFIATMQADQKLCELLNKGTDKEFKSLILGKAKNSSKILAEIRNELGVKSLSDYNFDLGSFSEQKRKDFITKSKTVEKDVSDLIRDWPNGNVVLKDFRDYVDFFNDVVRTFNSSNTKDKGLIKADARVFGINAGVMLEDILKARLETDQTLNDMIEVAYKKEFVSNEDFATLTKFRKFRNDCAHEITIGDMTEKERREVMRIIESLKLKSEGTKSEESK